MAQTHGGLLLPHARALCTEYARLSAEVDALHGLQSGHIRIGTFSSVATHWLPYILRAFSHDYPGIDYELLLGDYCPVRRIFRPSRASFCAIWTGAMPRRYPPEARDLTIGRDLCIITTKSLVFCEICPPASGDREESNVTYTVDDTMKKLLGAPEAVAVLERFFPKILKNPALQMTAAMTLRQVAGFAQSGLTADSLAEIDAQLRALPSSDG